MNRVLSKIPKLGFAVAFSGPAFVRQLPDYGVAGGRQDARCGMRDAGLGGEMTNDQ
jgi:hypothetical protein